MKNLLIIINVLWSLVSYSNDSLQLNSQVKEIKSLINSGNDSASILLDKLLVESQNNNDTHVLLKYYYLKGFLNDKSGEPKLAIDKFNQFIELKNDSLSFESIDQLNRIASCYKDLTELEQSDHYFKIAVDLSIRANYPKGIGDGYSGIGQILERKGKYEQGITYYLKAHDQYESINDSLGIGTTLNNIGNMMFYQGEYEQALEYYKKSGQIDLQLKNDKNLAMNYGNIGMIYNQIGNSDSALVYNLKCMDFLEKFNDQFLLGTIYNNIALVYSDLKQYDNAFTYHSKSKSIKEEIGDQNGLATSLINIGNLNVELEKFSNSLSYYQDGLKISVEINSPLIEMNAHKGLSKAYKNIKQYEKALNSYIRYSDIEDSLNNVTSKENIAILETKFETKEKEAQIEQQKKDHKNEMFIQEAKNKIKTILLIGVSILLLLVTFFVNIFYRKLKLTRQQKSIIQEQKLTVDKAFGELEIKNNEILDSITYAKRIQSAILPQGKVVKEYLKESFILYRPKDIVAGDFYWLEHSNNKVIFAVADCTGHGVPGALVSVVCNNGLNRSVREYGLTDPGQILDKTRELVIEEFEKSEDEIKDGMDIALCTLQDKKLQYAGAHNPLWIIRKDELIEVKANKQPIGKYFTKESYTSHTFDLEDGDTIYIFSDGYVDQFGGPSGKKLKSRPFKDFLLSIQSHSMEEQFSLIDQHFENWKGKIDQVDDVCMIGVRI